MNPLLRVVLLIVGIVLLGSGFGYGFRVRLFVDAPTPTRSCNPDSVAGPVVINPCSEVGK